MINFEAAIFITLIIALIFLISQNNEKKRRISILEDLRDRNGNSLKNLIEVEDTLKEKLQELEENLEAAHNEVNLQKQLLAHAEYKAGLYNRSQLILIKLLQEAKDRNDTTAQKALMKFYIATNPDTDDNK